MLRSVGVSVCSYCPSCPPSFRSISRSRASIHVRDPWRQKKKKRIEKKRKEIVVTITVRSIGSEILEHVWCESRFRRGSSVDFHNGTIDDETRGEERGRDRGRSRILFRRRRRRDSRSVSLGKHETKVGPKSKLDERDPRHRVVENVSLDSSSPKAPPLSSLHAPSQFHRHHYYYLFANFL